MIAGQTSISSIKIDNKCGWKTSSSWGQWEILPPCCPTSAAPFTPALLRMLQKLMSHAGADIQKCWEVPGMLWRHHSTARPTDPDGLGVARLGWPQWPHETIQNWPLCSARCCQLLQRQLCPQWGGGSECPLSSQIFCLYCISWLSSLSSEHALVCIICQWAEPLTQESIKVPYDPVIPEKVRKTAFTPEFCLQWS